MAYLVGYPTPQDYGATGNGVTDDSSAINAAITALQSAGGGTLFFPPATYLCNNLAVTASNVRLLGAGANASVLKKNGSGTLLSFTGATSPSSGSTHVRYCSVDNLGLNGNGQSGTALQLYYVDNFYIQNSQINSNNDLAIDCAEFWDSRFLNMVVVSCGGAANSTTQPNLWIRNASAASGPGASTGSSNNIHILGCRFEASLTGAIWITQGTSNSANPNNFKIISCKFEADGIQGGPLIQTDNTTKGVVISDINIQLGGFAGGYSTAQTAISLGGGNHVIDNVTIGNSGSATISSGLFLHAVGGSTIAVNNVIGGYTTNPTVCHVNFDATATGSYSVTNTPTSGGTQFGGTPPGLIFGYPRNLLVGANTALGDNGVGEIQLANAASIPSTNPTGGAAFYATGGQLATRNPQGLAQSLSGVIQTQTSTTTITGVTAETVLHTVTIPANDPAAGAVYHITGYGTFTAASGNLTWTVRWGGTSGTSIAALPTNTAPVLTNGLFWYDVTLTFRSTTSVTAAINLELGSSTSTDAATSYIGTPTGATTVTTTSSTALTVDVTPSVSGDSISLLGGCVRRLA